jgi:hypothetical protein
MREGVAEQLTALGQVHYQHPRARRPRARAGSTGGIEGVALVSALSELSAEVSAGSTGI